MINDALYRCQMCAASYAGYKGPTRHLPTLVWSHSTTEHVEIRREGRVLYLSFRGSDEIDDWYRNLDIHQVSVKDGQVAHGIDTGWNELHGAIHDRLAKESYHRLEIQGHSRGGALAHMAGNAFGVNPVTFGCPNFCNDEFANANSGTNFIAGKWFLLRDPVPHVPHHQSRPGEDIVLSDFGRPRKMHPVSNYIELLMRQS